jgi:hypothetical protein
VGKKKLFGDGLMRLEKKKEKIPTREGLLEDLKRKVYKHVGITFLSGCGGFG